MVKHHHLNMGKCVEYGNPTDKERPFQRETQLCHVCGNPYPVTGTRQEGFRVKRQVFNGHIQKHLPPGAELCYKCPQCSRSFADSPALKSHLLLKHNVGNKKRCTWCDKEYTSKATHNAHLQNVHSVCHYCQQSKGSRLAVIAHKKTCDKKTKWALLFLVIFDCWLRTKKFVPSTLVVKWM